MAVAGLVSSSYHFRTTPDLLTFSCLPPWQLFEYQFNWPKLGNIGTSPHDAEPINFNTPVLTNEIYTTGRGGTGNMAKNTNPEETRRAQDVTAWVFVSLSLDL